MEAEERRVFNDNLNISYSNEKSNEMNYSNAAEPEGGRFEFDDGGKYCGGWAEGKAHGFGVCTAPNRKGHFAGEWNLGFEVSGTYLWPNGNLYEGQWSGGRRSGLGVETKGRWIYRGEWTQGFKGRYGIRTSTASGARYEGTWTTGVQDGYGMETYADGGTYRGQWKDGMRHGYGVRQSAPYNLAAQYRKKAGSTGLDSLDMKDSTKDSEYSSTGDFLSKFNQIGTMPNNRGGFALKPSRSGTLDQRSSRGGSVPPTPSSGASPDLRRRIPTDFPQTSSLRMRIANTLRLKPSNGRSRSHDERAEINRKLSALEDAPPLRRINNSDYSTLPSPSRYYRTTEGRGVVGSMRSTDSLDSDHSILTDNTDTSFISQDGVPEDSSVVETYAGEWKHDKRCGYGVSERSDGVKYEGEWFNNKMNGYGVTTLPDGTKEEGKYRDNELVIRTGMSKAALLLPMRSAKQRHRIEEAVGRAIRAAHEAMQRTEITLQRVMMARSKAKSADSAAGQAKEDAELAQKASKLYENIPLRIDNKPGDFDNMMTSSGNSSSERLNGEARRDVTTTKDSQTPKRTRSFIARVFSAGKGDKKTRPNVEVRTRLRSADSEDPLTGEVGSVSRQNSKSRYARRPRGGRDEGQDIAETRNLAERPNKEITSIYQKELLNSSSNLTRTSSLKNERKTLDAAAPSILRNGYDHLRNGRTDGFDDRTTNHISNGQVPPPNIDFKTNGYNNLAIHTNGFAIDETEYPLENNGLSARNECSKCERSLCVCPSYSRDHSPTVSSLASEVNSHAPYTFTESQPYYSGPGGNRNPSELSEGESNGLLVRRPQTYNNGNIYSENQSENSQFETARALAGLNEASAVRYPTNSTNTRQNQGQGLLENHTPDKTGLNQRRRNSQPDFSSATVVPPSGPLSWEQLTALSRQRQEELRKEREKQNRSGLVIVFSLGGLKDWIQNHQFLAFVVAFNICLAFIFFKLI